MDKLQELTQKLYDQGLAKGKEEGEAILAKAREEAQDIIRKAQEEANAIVEKARLPHPGGRRRETGRHPVAAGHPQRY